MWWPVRQRFVALALALVGCGQEATTLQGASNPDSGRVFDAGIDSHETMICTRPDSVADSSSASCPLGPLLFSNSLTIVSISGFTSSMATGDFNGDGKADLALTTQCDQALVFLGRGDGTFGTPTSFAAGASSSVIVTGDFNREGKLDLATNVSVLLGNGDGTFRAPLIYGVAEGCECGGLELMTGDFNGDGNLDLATEQGTMLGAGNGTFGGSTSYETAVASPIATGDFNDDGNLDLATEDVLLLGQGNGTFRAGGKFSTYNMVSLMAVSDFNGDCHLDVAVAGTGVGVLLGRGDGTFGAATIYFGGCDDLAGVASGDFNGDGKLDLATSDGVLLGEGDGTFEIGEAFGPGGFVSTGDFNGDGKLDVAQTRADALGIRLGRGDGTFGEAAFFMWPIQGGGNLGPVQVADFDQDGKLDVATAVGSSNAALLVFRGRGDGTFEDPWAYLAGDNPMFITAGDWNGDGKIDFAAVGINFSALAVLLNATPCLP
jgi:hypothetical protein